MRVVRFPEESTWDALCERPTAPPEEFAERVRPIMDAVRESGDAALIRLTEQFDGVDLSPGMSPVSSSLGDLSISSGGAEPLLAPELASSIRTAIRNIRRFHEAQWESVRRIETTEGVTCWRRSIPIERVGLYVPGGSAPLFSTVLMLGIPAQIAGCQQVVLCTPPAKDGSVHPAIRFAAHEVGIRRVVPVGGAQAIGAMTYGTESVPRVDKLFGPGNQYVTAAKQLAALGGTAIDMPAGPTEVAIVVDGTSNPAFVAADVLAQAEHGPDSQILVVTSDDAIVAGILESVDTQLKALPRADVARQALENSVLAVVRDRDEALALVNHYAAEHLILAVDDATYLADRVRQAGSVFVGHLATESIGDYASGTNHTLPTGGAARAYSGVSLDSFLRKVTFQEISPDGLKRLGPAVEHMARAEMLDGHANAVSERLKVIGRTVGAPHRVADVHRETSETSIRIRLDLDGSGRAEIHTGLSFYDHMLEQIARHGGVDLDVSVRGDLHIDEHHTVEDTAIALGTALRRALGDKRGIERYGFLLPMDDALAQVALDFGGRAWLVWDVPFSRERVGDVPTELWSHFFKSLSDAAGCNLNISASGENDHHLIEAVFKGFARALRQAIRRDSGSSDIPSTKGTL